MVIRMCYVNKAADAAVFHPRRIWTIRNAEYDTCKCCSNCRHARDA
jgi:hypothetical protein